MVNKKDINPNIHTNNTNPPYSKHNKSVTRYFKSLNTYIQHKKNKYGRFKVFQLLFKKIKNLFVKPLADTNELSLQPGKAELPTANQLNSIKTSPKIEPTSEVWQGEPGPELPTSYNKTILRAIPKNPHTAYVYWDIDQKSQKKIHNQKQPLHTVLRVYGGTNLPQTEINVQLEPHHCYVDLQPDQTYAFELGAIDQENHYQTLVRSNLLTMPPDIHLSATQQSQDHNNNLPTSLKAISSPTSWMDATSTFKSYE